MSRHMLAYLDPTTGSVAYQIALSSALAAAAAVKMYWKRLKTLFRGKDKEIPESVKEASDVKSDISTLFQ